eukprot:gene1210-1527_t
MSNIKTLHLYRNLVRASKLFLIDESRKDRCLSSFINSNVKKLFRENKNLTDKKQIQSLVSKAEKEYSSFKDLVENKYLIKYPCSITVRPIAVHKTNYLLSSESQQKIKAKKWGFLDRVMVVFNNNNNN